ncbi:MAG: hypothetical protein VB934_14440, partial [Polyangiaceae bacterium]
MTPRSAFHLHCLRRVLPVVAVGLLIACGGGTNTATDSGSGTSGATGGASGGGDPALEKYLS